MFYSCYYCVTFYFIEITLIEHVNVNNKIKSKLWSLQNLTINIPN